VHVHTARTITGLEDWAGVHDLDTDEDGAAFEVDGHLLGDLIRHLATFDILMLTCTPPTLEDLFLRHYGDELATLAGNGGTE
jgi:ABC-2 type transport system ATP-binding protein